MVAVAWASAGFTPLTEALKEVRTPADFTRDFVTAHARVHGGRLAPPSGEDGNAYAATIGAPAVALLGGPYHLHPPAALLPVLPLVPLGFHGAALAWLALSLGALGVLARELVALARPAGPTPLTVSATFLALALWPPTLHNLAKGQWSILLAALIAVGFRALEQGRARVAGLGLGAAVSLKLTPVVLLGYLVLRQPRAAKVVILVVAGAALIGLLVAGAPAYAAWVADVPRDVAIWQTWFANTASFNGLFARLFAGDAFARPLASAPALARALHLATSLALVGAAALATWRTPPSREANRALGAAWIAAVVLLNPLAWSHTQLLALPALALLAGLAPTGALLAALALMSVPRQVLVALAGPAPLTPAVAPLLSLHAAALLLVFVTALRAVAATRRAAPAADIIAETAP
jgi:hypothetical protein